MFETIEIYLIRHAESWFNRDKSSKIRNCGLTRKGIQQSLNLGNVLKPIEFDILIVSPLLRCQQTFEFSKLNFKTVIVHPLCREQKTDDCDFFCGEAKEFESDEQIELRILAFKNYLHDLIKKHQTTKPISKIAIITHGDFIFQFVSENIEGTIFGHWFENAEYNSYPFGLLINL